MHRQRHPSSQLGWTVLLLGQVINTLLYVFISIKENSTLNKMSFSAGRMNRSPLTLNLRINRLCSFFIVLQLTYWGCLCCRGWPPFVFIIFIILCLRGNRQNFSFSYYTFRSFSLSLLFVVFVVFSFMSGHWCSCFVCSFFVCLGKLMRRFYCHVFIIYRLSSVSGCFSIVWG